MATKRSACVLLTAVAISATIGAAPKAAGISREVPNTAGSHDVAIHPLVPGTHGYHAGTFVWTDYPYDDTGASTDDVEGGQDTYPSSATPGNAADLIQLQLTPTGTGLRVSAVLETLVQRNLPLLGVGFDADDNPATGARRMPGSGWTTEGRLGLEDLLTVSRSGSVLRHWSGSRWQVVGHFPARIDPGANLMQTTIPGSLLPPRHGIWRAVGVLGLAAPGHSWLDGTGPIYDLAFVHGEPCSEALICTASLATDAGGSVTGQNSGQWQDRRQAAILGGRLGASDAEAAIHFARLARRVTAMPNVTRPGFHTLLYFSPLRLGEGKPTVNGFLGPTTENAGPYQPYLVKVPHAAHWPSPLLIFLHGLGENHMSNAYLFETSATATGPASAGGSFSVPAVVAFPLGRGTAVGYSGVGEQDVLDVFRDVTHRYRINRNRVVLSGMSMGGIGTFHVGEDYPDRFTALVPIVGEDQPSTGASIGTGLLENLINLHVRMQNGALDPLVAAPSVVQTDLALDRLADVDYRSFVALRRTHEVDPPLVGCWYQRYLARHRVRNPARVVFAVDADNEYDNHSTGLRLHHDGAYWVSGIRSRAGADGRVDAVSRANGRRTITARPVTGVGQNLTMGADDCGPNPAARTDEPWTMHGMAVTRGKAARTRNGLDLTVTGIAKATFDMRRAGLESSRPIRLNITGDGHTRLRFRAQWRSRLVRVRVDRRQVKTVRVHGGVVPLTANFAGHHVYTILPAGRVLGSS